MLREQLRHSDIAFAPRDEVSVIEDHPHQEFTGALLRWTLEYMRKKFHFRWALFAHDTVYFHTGSFMETLVRMGEPENAIAARFEDVVLPPAASALLGGSGADQADQQAATDHTQEDPTTTLKLADGLFFVLSRDLFQVFTAHSMITRLNVRGTVSQTLVRIYYHYYLQLICKASTVYRF